MTIDPARQAALFAASFAAGLLFGLFLDALAALRALFCLTVPPDALKKRYLTPLPLIGKPVGLIQQTPPLQTLRAVLSALGDVLLPSLAATLLVVVTFVYNDGTLRPLSLILCLLGLFLWRVAVGAHLALPLAWLSFALAVFLRYLVYFLLLPVRLVCRMTVRWLLMPLRHLLASCHRRLVEARTARLCRRELAAAAEGFGILK